MKTVISEYRLALILKTTIKATLGLLIITLTLALLTT
jgi:hypothetical protein